MSRQAVPSNEKKAKRTREITIRVNEYELAKIKKRNRGSTVAGWLRDLALGVTPVKTVDPALVRQLGRIGSNLNQVVKTIHIDKEIDQQALSEIKAIREYLHELLEMSVKQSKAAVGENDDC